MIDIRTIPPENMADHLIKMFFPFAMLHIDGTLYNSQQCALIHVRELKQHCKDEHISYWNKVEFEIENYKTWKRHK